MPLPTLQFPLDRFPQEVGLPLPVLQDGPDALQGALREPGNGLFVVDLGASSWHGGKISDITNYYKLQNRCYHLLTARELMISSFPSEQEMEMTKQLTLGTATLTQNDEAGTITVRFMNLGSFIVGQQIFGNSRQGANAALRFCRERALQVIEA